MRFIYSNEWDSITTIDYTSQDSNFPASNAQHRWHTRSYRSRYGSGTGWGNFVIEAGSNDKIDFEETNGVELTAILTAAVYTTATLVTEIKTQLDAAGASTYTVSYSDSTNKFTLASDGAGGGGIFKLRWATGTNTATSVGSTIGFDVSADDSGALTYTGDYTRIHSEEALKVDRGVSSPGITAVIIRYNNFSSNATIQVQANSSDSWGSPAYSQTLTVNNEIMVHFPTSAQAYRYWQIRIRDVSNSDGYVEMGRIFLGTYFEPAQEVHTNYGITPSDPSAMTFSEGGQLSSIQRQYYDQFNYFIPATTEKSSLDAVFASRGTSKNLFVCEDESDPNSYTYYVRISSWQYSHISYGTWMLNFSLEELR